MKLKATNIPRYFKISYQIVPLLFALLLPISISFFSSPVANAATAANPTQQQIFDDQICKPIGYPSECKDYTTQADLDAAEKDVCNKYKSNSQVQSGCQSYSAAAESVAYIPPTNDTCGGPTDNPVHLSIAIGCEGKGNPIADATFAIIRILSDGVGLVVVASIIVGGIQYTTAQSDPQATAKAVGRIRSSVLALIIFIFGYAILNYLIPAGVL